MFFFFISSFNYSFISFQFICILISIVYIKFIFKFSSVAIKNDRVFESSVTLKSDRIFESSVALKNNRVFEISVALKNDRVFEISVALKNDRVFEISVALKNFRVFENSVYKMPIILPLIKCGNGPISGSQNAVTRTAKVWSLFWITKLPYSLFWLFLFSVPEY